MSSLADLPDLVGFFSYSREDDADSQGALSALRGRIQGELRGQLGRTAKTFRLWQDKEAIASGTLWQTEIKNAVAQAQFFIPIITPTVIASPYCRFELDEFLSREAALGRTDLVFPILYIRVPALEDAVRCENDPVLSLIARRQYVDWREFRYLDANSTEVKKAVGQFCTHIHDALNRPWLSPQERVAREEDAAQQRAEEDRKGREAEALRQGEEARKREAATRERERAEEERRQREVEAEQRKAEERRLRDEAKGRRRAEEEQRRVAKEELAQQRSSKARPLWPPSQLVLAAGAGFGLIIIAAIGVWFMGQPTHEPTQTVATAPPQAPVASVPLTQPPASAPPASTAPAPTTQPLPSPALSTQGRPPIGTWPDGSSGSTVNIGAVVPLTGTYAAEGEDELKGWQLAVEHINEGNDLIKTIAPKVTKGVLGKQVNLLFADSGAKPNDAVQAEQKFITDNNIILMTGSTSSAVAVALNKFAEREKVLYVTGISGSNDTTGKDCVRYGFRQNFYGETAANAIGPTLVKAYGSDRKVAFMTPDYTYGQTMTKSVNDYLTSHGGWTMVTNQISPLGTQDFSRYLTNIANSGAEYVVNVNWGHDAVLSIQQAKQFGLMAKTTMVIPYQTPFLAKDVGPELTAGVYAATDFWWTLRDKFPLAKMFVDAFYKKYNYRPEWGANNAYMSLAIWARMISEAGTFYPPDVIKEYEKGETFASTVGDVHFRPEDHQLVRSVIIVRGKAPKDMKNSEDYWDVLEVMPGAPLMQAPDAFGCNLGGYT